MVLSAIGRIFWVPIAFVLAGLGAAFILFTLGMERVTQTMHGASDTQAIDTLFDVLLQAQLLISGLTLVPAILVVVVGEVARIRSALYYILGGGAALAAIPLLARLGQAASTAAAMPSSTLWQVFATAGFFGGLLYWLMAGRRA